MFICMFCYMIIRSLFGWLNYCIFIHPLVSFIILIMQPYHHHQSHKHIVKHVSFHPNNNCSRCNLNQVSPRFIQPSSNRNNRIQTQPSEKMPSIHTQSKKVDKKRQTTESLKHPHQHNVNNEHLSSIQKSLKLKKFLENNDYFIQKWREESQEEDRRFKSKLVEAATLSPLKSLKSLRKLTQEKQSQRDSTKISPKKLMKIHDQIRRKTQLFEREIVPSKIVTKKKAKILQVGYKGNIQQIIVQLQQSKQQLQKARKMLKRSLKSQQKSKLKRKQQLAKRKIIQEIEDEYDLYHRHEETKKEMKRHHEDLERELLSQAKEFRENKEYKQEPRYVYQDNLQEKMFQYTNEKWLIEKKPELIHKKDALSQTDQTYTFQRELPELKQKEKQQPKQRHSMHKRVTLPTNTELPRLQSDISTKPKLLKKHQTSEQQEQQIQLGIRQNPQISKKMNN